MWRMWQKVNIVPAQNLNVKGHVNNLGVDVIIILKWIKTKQDGEDIDWIGSERRPVASYCNQDVKFWSSIKHWEFIYYPTA